MDYKRLNLKKGRDKDPAPLLIQYPMKNHIKVKQGQAGDVITFSRNVA